MSYAKVVFGLPVQGPFDYYIPKKISKYTKVGSRVSVPFRNSKKIGYVVGLSKTSKIKKIKSIISLIDYKPIFDKDTLGLLERIANYYCCSWGEMIETALPLSIRKGKRLVVNNLKSNRVKKRYSKDASRIFLVHDVAADERWDFILKEIKKTLSLKQGVIFLEPNLLYIKRRVEWIKEKIGKDVAILHSRQSERTELNQWLKIKEGEINIVVGSRSAVFAPVKDLGLIIINEEDNQVYKQEQVPFYHVREVAALRIKQNKAGLILASQTPSLESYNSVLKRKYKNIILDKRSDARLQIEIVDMNQELIALKKYKIILSPQLEHNIQKTLESSGKIILFINRLGFSTSIRCKNCGYVLKCNRCNAALTYQYKKKMLICRFCNYKMKPVEICPQCNTSYIRYSGMGAEKLESEINRIFPQAKTVRWDSDVGIQDNDFDILIATQILLKENIDCDLLAVLQVDSSLNRVDFRSSEKTFSLLFRLSQIAKKKMVIQTRNPQHNCIEAIKKSNPFLFLKKELKLRKELSFPPFKHFIQVQLRGRTESKVKDLAFSLFEKINNKNNNIDTLEPFPALPSRLRGSYRWNILLKCNSVKAINSYIKKCLKKLKRKSGIIINVNVDI